MVEVVEACLNLPKEMLWGSSAGMPPSLLIETDGVPHGKLNDLSKSAVALDQDSTLISVIEMSQSNWLVAGIAPGSSATH